MAEIPDSSSDQSDSSPESGVSNKTRWRLLIPSMLLPVVGAYLYFDLWNGTTIAAIVYPATKIFTIVFPIFCAFFVLRCGLPFRSHPASFHLRALPAGLVLGGAIMGVAYLVLQSPIDPMIEAAGPQIKEHLAGTPWLNYFWPIAIAISIIHSFVEEFYWRWFVYGKLLRRVLPKPGAVLLGGFAFSLHHIVVLTQFFPGPLALGFSACVGIGGMFWSLLMDHQKSLAGAWVSHMVVDFGMLTIGYYLMFP